MQKVTPEKFSLSLRDSLLSGGRPSALAEVPKNKRPTYENTIQQFELMGQCFSPSGMTANIVMMYLQARREPFVVTYSPDHGFTVRRR